MGVKALTKFKDVDGHYPALQYKDINFLSYEFGIVCLY